MKLKKQYKVSLMSHVIVNFVVFVFSLFYIILLLVMPCNERTVLLMGTCDFARVSIPLVVLSWFLAFVLVSSLIRFIFIRKESAELYKIAVVYVISFLLGQNLVFLISPFLLFLTNSIGGLLM
jgi:hypothetical protein